MPSPGSPSKWQVRDSQSSNPSLLYSEIEQTEDESDMFSSEGTKSSEPSLESVKQRGVRDKSGHAGSPSTSPVYQSPAATERIPTAGDLSFARKCSELHGYVRPLLELLNGLKTGRFEKGLSTYQQNVAMDRLRKILGVLQKPDLGEKYLGILLQLEVMLKVWFPQVILQQRDGSPSFHSPTAGRPLRWNQDQLHIPVKKRRLSWSDSDSQGSPSYKRFHEDERGRSFSDAGSWLSSSETTSSDIEDENAVCANRKEMTSELKFTENSGLSPFNQKTDSLNSSVGTQDCSVSSTTTTSNSPADTEISGNAEVSSAATQSCSRSMEGEEPKKQSLSKSSHTKTSST